MRASSTRGWTACGAVVVLLVVSGCGDGDSISSSGDATPGDADGGDVFAAARRALDAGQISEGIARLRGSLSSLSAAKRGVALATMARYYLIADRPAGALKAADEGLAIGTRSYELLWGKGESLRRRMQLDEARQLLDEALGMSESNHAVRLSLARIKFRAEEPASALTDFEAYLEHAPAEDSDRDTARLEYGRALRAARRFQDAADQFTTLLETDPTESEYYSELSATLYRMRRRNEARFVEQIFRAQSQHGFEEYGAEKLRAQGRDALALAQGGIVAARRKKFAEAYDLYRKAFEANLAASHGDVKIVQLHVEFCLRLRRRREALAAAKMAIQKGWQPLSGLWWARARVEAELEDWKAAADSLRQAAGTLKAEIDRGEKLPVGRGQAASLPVLLGLCRADLEMGQLERADRGLKRAGDLEPSAWEPVYWQGRVSVARGDYRRALEHFADAAGRARRLGREALPDLGLWRAVAMGHLGREAQAIDILTKGLNEHPDRVELWPELIELVSRDEARRRQVQKVFDDVSMGVSAIDRATESLDQTPFDKSARVYFDLGRALRKLRDRAGVDYLLLATDLAPRDVEIARSVSSLLGRGHDIFVRLALMRRILVVDPNSVDALHDVAEIYTRFHVRLSDAEDLAKRLHELAPDESSYTLRARAALLLGRREDARSLAREGLARHPGSRKLEEILAQ